MWKSVLKASAAVAVGVTLSAQAFLRLLLKKCKLSVKQQALQQQ